MQYLTADCRDKSEDHREENYHSLVLRGKMRTVVRWITEQETGGELHPEELCIKTGERVMEVMRTKNLDARPLSASSLDTYTDRPQEIVLVVITKDTVTEVVG